MRLRNGFTSPFLAQSHHANDDYGYAGLLEPWHHMRHIAATGRTHMPMSGIDG
jgi:hypothetical protein